MAAADEHMPSSKQRPDPAGTETSPLLGPRVDSTYGSSSVEISSATVIGDDEVTNSSGSSATVGNGSGGDAEQAVTREGLPEMAKKMHIILPAIGIGIFLCALDQTLIVATYARMSSDLEALNRTSWISTAWVPLFNTYHSVETYKRVIQVFLDADVLPAPLREAE